MKQTSRRASDESESERKEVSHVLEIVKKKDKGYSYHSVSRSSSFFGQRLTP